MNVLGCGRSLPKKLSATGLAVSLVLRTSGPEHAPRKTILCVRTKFLVIMADVFFSGWFARGCSIAARRSSVLGILIADSSHVVVNGRDGTT